MSSLIGGQIIGVEAPGTTLGILRRIDVKGQFVEFVQDWKAAMTGGAPIEAALWEVECPDETQVFAYTNGWGSASLQEDGTVRVSIPMIGRVTLYPVGQGPVDLSKVMGLPVPIA